MIRKTGIAVLVMGLCVPAFGGEKIKKGNCPPPPPISSVRSHKATVAVHPSKDDVRTVTIMAVISDTGYVCSAQVAASDDKLLNDEAVETVRKWHFDPAMRDGKPVAVAITVEVNFRPGHEAEPVVQR